MGECDSVYTERNRLVLALTKFFPSYMIRDIEAEEGWQHIVYIEGNAGQMSWHIGDDDLHLFSHMTVHSNAFKVWDGHTTEEKYERLAQIKSPADNMSTILTYKQALAVHGALQAAHNVEKTNLQLEALRGSGMVRESPLMKKLSLATHIMDMKRERAEEMGG